MDSELSIMCTKWYCQKKE